MTRVAVSQSNYIPWIGYFEMISSVTDFVFLDNVQYTNRDWRNRNQIKTPQGKIWLSLEVDFEEKISLIQDVKILDKGTKNRHLEAIRRNYRRSKFFDEVFPEIVEFYESHQGDSLSDFNQHLIKSLSTKLGIRTQFHNAREFPIDSDASRRILEICLRLKASTYVSGPSAQDYLNMDIFKSNSIQIEWFQYSSDVYRQLWGDFNQYVSILDPILNNGWDVLRKRRSEE